MPKFHSTVSLLCCCLTTGMIADDRATSFNDVIQVVPAPGPVIIDGTTDDWDLSAGVWSYNDPTIVDRHSVWTHLMWDAKGVYFLAVVSDPNPMRNAASGKDFHMSWQADCYQARVVFDDRTPDEHQLHINMYWSSTDQQPYQIVKHGGFKSQQPYDETGPDRPDQLQRWGTTMTECGGAFAVKAWDDGKGYNMEGFWPWEYLRTSGQVLEPGGQFTFGIETMWGSSDGTTLVHRLADGIKDETVNRIFMFRARDGWGRAVISPVGNLAISEAQRELHQKRLRRFYDYGTYGSVPITYAVPVKSDVTIAIDDAEGRRVRNLFGQFPRDPGEIQDFWDCLDDAGNPVSPGAYTATILHHEPIGLKFANSVYSASIPPWTTERGSLFWGSNHGYPTSVATRGDATVLFFTGTEGGSGIQRIDDRGVIQWRDGQEFLDGALDDQFAYGLSRSHWQNKTLLFRYDLKSGQMTPWDNAERTPGIEVVADAEMPDLCTLAFAHGALWVQIHGQPIRRFERGTGAVSLPGVPDDVIALTDRDDRLYALRRDGAVLELDASGSIHATIVTVNGLQDPQRLAVDATGERFLISDHGTNQVILVRKDGTILHRFGTAYAGAERPAGIFIPTDLIRPMGAGFDHLGRIWIPEGVKSCKRVSLWSAEGKLIDQFWGQADYGAMAAFPVTFDSTRFIAHGIEFRLDPAPNPWQRKTEEQPLVFHPALSEERGVVYLVDGREYACAAPGFGKPDSLTIFRRDDQGVFVPCVRATATLRERVGDGNQWQVTPGRGWVDRNGNGQEEADEIVDNIDWHNPYWSNGWVRPDLTMMSPNGLVFKPQGFNAAGVPLYDFSDPVRLDLPPMEERNSTGGTPVIDNAGNVSNGMTWLTADGRTGNYPNPYGRHDAPASQRGLLIAPFRTNGVVEDVPGVGSITALGSDRGEWFLLSMDGLYISSICQDIKANVVLDETLTGGESFGGFIWRDTSTGKVMVQLGGASYRIMEVTGLETCVKETRTLIVDEAAIRQGVAIAQERRSTQVAEPPRLRIAAVRALPSAPVPVMQPLSKPLIEGAVDVKVSAPGNPSTWWRAALAISGQDLVVMWQVADTSPWRNGEGQFTHAFIGGDAVDVQLNIPGRGPVRILGAKIGGENTVVYWQQQAAAGEHAITYSVPNNPGNATSFPLVRRLESATLQVLTGFNAYSALLRIPLADIGMSDIRGQEITGLVGVIYSDPSGSNRASRVYWHDKETGMVNDVPTEARLVPQRWGPIDIDR